MFKNEWVRFGTSGEHLGLTTWPERATPPIPAIVVIQEAWGVDPHIEDVAARFARAGYLTLAPDLFAEHGTRPDPLSRPRLEALKQFINTMPPAAWTDPAARDQALAALPEPARSNLSESFQALFTSVMSRIDAFVPGLLAAVEYLRGHPMSQTAKIGAVGYCLGGTLTARLACACPHLSAAAMYYGGAPPLDAVANVTCPVLGFYGALDTRVNAGIADFAAAMERHHKRFEYHIYDGAPHAFFNDTRPSYNVRASRDAFARTLELFRREL
ncbi:MAG TPA: dienelactone hydrolase family protein [Gemmatimonadales bacterium]|nr:dienelactone hydrolase family protein [Gemmatimonadales bacterium]